MASKGKNKKWTIARHCVQGFILLLFLAPVLITGWGLFGFSMQDAAYTEPIATPSGLPFYGTLSSSQVGPLTLVDPFTALQVFFASKTLETSVILGLLPVLVVFALVRGRAFCGWVCPVNFILEGIDVLRKKLFPHKQLPEHVLPRYTKIGIAAAVLILSAIISIPLWEAMNPISFVIKGLVYGGVAGGLSFLAAILLDLFFGHRVWCRALCPIGGFYQIVGKVGLIKVNHDAETCINCNKCKKACLSDPEILEPVLANEVSFVCSGDCMICGKCIDACPTNSLSMGIGLPAKNQLMPLKRKTPELKQEDEKATA